MVEEKHIDKSKQGKLNRASGRRFEAKIRAELEAMGWTVDKWTNTVDYNRENGIGKVVPAKRKYNPFMKVMAIGTGFPDFICIRSKKADKITDETGNEMELGSGNYDVMGVEVKRNGYLDQVEKGMCYWLLENKIFSRILIAKAKKEGKRMEVEYVDFTEKYKK